eukprot:Gb_07045 [translate_table: standard]
MAWRQAVQVCVRGENRDGADERGPGQRRLCEPYQHYDACDESVQRRKKRACLISAREDDIDGDSKDLNRVGSFCGRETMYSTTFGFLFPNKSYPMDASNCIQIDTTHWILDMSVFVGEAYDEVKEICVFLLREMVFPPGKALAVFTQSPGSQFQYCGAVHTGCPSAVLSLLWPSAGGHMQLMAPNSAPLTAKIGICVEDLVCLPSLNMGEQKRAEELATKLGENLFNFMQSFCSVEMNKLVVPMDILDKWFKRLQERSKRDPACLKGFAV